MYLFFAFILWDKAAHFSTIRVGMKKSTSILSLLRQRYELWYEVQIKLT